MPSVRGARASKKRPQGDPKLAIVYLRVSTDQQEHSFDVQWGAIQRWCAKEGVSVIGEPFADRLSGSLDDEDRPQLHAAIEAVKTHRAGKLLVAKRDRLARDPFITMRIERELAPFGARVQSADGQGNGESDSDALMRHILDGVAAYERSLIRSRIKNTLAMRKESGHRVGMVPYGYSPGPNKVLVPNEAEQAVLVRVRALHADGFTQVAIARQLESEGIRSRGGKPLQQTQIQRILSRGK